jgi:lipid-binding SYLF domain-containing protein
MNVQSTRSSFALFARDSVNRVSDAKTVMEEIMAAPDNGIPHDLLHNVHRVVIVPAFKRGGFIVGAQHGKALATCRQPLGTGWTGYSTVRTEGGSFGLQIGGGEMDVVMMKGAPLRSDDRDDAELNGRPVKHEGILTGRVSAHPVANPLLLMLNNYSSVEDNPAGEPIKFKKNN